MIIFFLVAAIMLAVALAFVLIPLLKPRRPGAPEISDESSNVSIFRAQKEELDADVARGFITAQERDAAMAELGARVLSEVPFLSSTNENSRVATAFETEAKTERRSWIAALCLATSIPLAAILIYLSVGSPQGMLAARAGVANTNIVTGADPSVGTGQTIDAGKNPANSANPGSPPLSDKQILGMVDSLAKKMNDNPDDPKGWILLARSQNALGRYTEAVAAYERAIQLVPNDSLVLADYADVLVAAKNGRFDGKPYEIILKALKLDQNNMKALALAGTAEMRLGNRPASLKYWQKLQTLVVKDSEDYREVQAIIAEVSGTPAPVTAPSSTLPNSPTSAPQGSISAAEDSASKGAGAVSVVGSKVDPGAAVSGSVSMTPELLAKIAPGDTLFVLARAIGAAGVNAPRMPLAVLRIPVPKKWPYAFTLTDAMAMAPGMSLSSFPQFSVEARISKSGGAVPQSGDMTSMAQDPTDVSKTPVKAGAKNLNITISRMVP